MPDGSEVPTTVTPETRAKLARLEELLRGYDRLVIAYSGGVDSVFLAVIAARVLGERALAVTAQSESLAPEELEEAAALARRFGFAHQVVRTGELRDPRYAANPRDRCYFCKSELMDKLLEIARGKWGQTPFCPSKMVSVPHFPHEREQDGRAEPEAQAVE